MRAIHTIIRCTLSPHELYDHWILNVGQHSNHTSDMCYSYFKVQTAVGSTNVDKAVGSQKENRGVALYIPSKSDLKPIGNTVAELASSYQEHDAMLCIEAVGLITTCMYDRQLIARVFNDIVDLTCIDKNIGCGVGGGLSSGRLRSLEIPTDPVLT